MGFAWTASAGLNTWTTNGPYGGNIKAIALSPNYSTDKTLFAGTSGNGLFKSTNGGATWTAAWNNATIAVAVSPNFVSDGTVFIGTSSGVYKSVNGGTSWTLSGSIGSAYCVGISPNYASDSTVFAGTSSGGMYKTTNGGTSWTAVNTGLTGSFIYSLAISPNYAADQTVLAGTWSNGLFKSTNGGASWSTANTGISGNNIPAIAFSPGYATDSTVYVGVPNGVYKSTNGGAGWTATNTGLTTTYILSLAVSPNFATDNTVYAGTNGGGVFKSANGGASWSAASTGITSNSNTGNKYIPTLAVSPSFTTDNTVFAGSDISVFKTASAGVSWTAVTTGLASLPVNSIAVSPCVATDHTVYLATGMGVLKSVDGCASWSNLNASGYSCIAISPNYSTDQTVFTESARTTTGGASWSPMFIGSGNTVYAIVISPGYATDHTVFAASSNGVFKSTNSGASWTSVSSTGVTVIAVSPNYSTDNTVFAGVGSSVYKSTNGGTSWTQVSSSIAGNRMWALVASPNYASDNTIFAGTWNTGGVSKSTNGGTSWTTVNTGITDRDVLSLAVSPNYASDQTLYAGTLYAGMFKTASGGTSWSALNSGLGSVDVTAVAVSPNYGTDQTAFAGAYALYAFSSTNAIPPSSAVTAPAAGTYLKGTGAAITGTAAGNLSGSSVQEVEVGITPQGGTTTWTALSSSATSDNWAHWSYTWTLSADGSYTITSRATDNVSNVETPGAGVTVMVDNTPPVVSAGVNKAAHAQFTQTATATDANSMTYSWSKVSGPGTVTFGSPAALSTTISASVDGTYIIQFTATDAAANSSSSTMTLTWDTTSPTVSAGANQTANAQFTQTATATDVNSMTYSWSKVSGPGTVTFGSPTALSTTISASVDGTYVLRITATDAAANSSSSTMTLAWDTTPPVVSAGQNGLGGGYNFIQTATASDANPMTYVWSKVSGPGAVSFGSPTALSTAIYPTAEGTYVLQFTATDAAGNSASSTMTLTWNTTPPTVSAGPDRITHSQFTQPATVTDASPIYNSYWSMLSGPGNITFGSPYSIFTTISADTDGVYVIQFSAEDAAGNTGYSTMTLTWTTSVGPFAYIPNSNDNTVSVIDTPTDTIVATIPVGTYPFCVAVNPAGTKAYVGNYGSNSVSVIDTVTNTVVATVGLPGYYGTYGPYGIAVNASGTSVYTVGNENGSVIDASTNTVVAEIYGGMDYPYAIAMSPDGAKAYVTTWDNNNVSVIDTSINSVVAMVPVGSYPFGIAVSPAGTKAYVTNYGSNSVSVIDTSTDSVVASVAVGSGPWGVAFNPAGTKAYVANRDSNTVSVIDTSTDTVIATVEVGLWPEGISVTPDGTKVYVADTNSNNISVINTATNSVDATVPVGSGPIALGMFIGPWMGPTDTTPPVVSAGGNKAARAMFTQTATATDASAMTYYWTNESRQGGVITFGSPTSLTTTISANMDATYTLQFTAIDAAGNASSSQMTLIWETTPPTVSAGANKTANAQFTQTATATDANSMTYSWSKVSGPGTVTFGSPAALSTTISASVDGTYTIGFTATDVAGNSASSTMILTWDATPPAVSAGANKTANAQFTQTATATDANSMTYSWSKVSGPGTVTLGSPAALSTTISANTDGTYTIQFTATDAAANSASSTMTLTWDTTPPTVGAGANKTANSQFTQTATATDANSMTYSWSKVAGPGTVTFGSPTALSTTISANTDGTYTIQFTATDAAGNSSSSTMMLTWDTTPPTVSAGANKTANSQFTQTATATDANSMTYSWSKVSGPGTVAFGSPTALSTTISANVYGTYTIQFTATDAAGNSSSAQMTLVWSTTGGPGTMQWTTNGPFGGNILSVAVSPGYATDQIVFAGTATGNVYKSVNGGAGWTGLSITSQGVNAIAISPNFSADHTVFMGSYAGVYKSTDGGGSWTAINVNIIDSLAISPNYAADQTVFAGSGNGGIYKSVNGGASWTTVDANYVSAFAISPSFASDNTIFAGGTLGLYKSVDGGTSWTTVSSTDVTALAISPSYASDRTIFSGDYMTGIYKSTDGGSSWAAVRNNLYIEAVAISPNYASDETIFAGFENGNGVLKSTDGGSSWTAADNGLTNLFIRALAISPNYASDQALFAGTDNGMNSGLFKSTNGGTSWTAYNNGISGTAIDAVVVSPGFAADRTLYAGTYGSGLFKSTDAAASWTAVNSGITGTSITALSISPNYSCDNTVFAGTPSAGVFKSTNGGMSWAAINQGMAEDAIRSLAISPRYVSDHTVFAGTHDAGIFKSTDSGNTWTAVNTGLPRTTRMEMLPIAVSPNYANDQTVYAGQYLFGVYKSTNGGSSWTAVNTGITNTIIQSISVSPNYAADRTVFVGSDGGVFKSTNGGSSWTAVNTGITDTHIQAVVVSPNYATDHTVVAGSDGGGVYMSVDGGASWSAINTGLSNLNITSLCISPNYATDYTVFAGSYGGGVSSCTTGIAPPVVNAGGNKTANAQFTQTATATGGVSPVTYSWSKLSGPGTITFGSPTALSTTVSAGVDGTYVLQFTATDAAASSASSTMTLTWDTTPPAVSAGADKTANSTFTQTATATDVNSMTYQWSQVSGPGTVTFGTPAALSTTLSASNDGTYTIRFTATDAAGNSASSTMTLTWDTTLPVVSAGPNKSTHAQFTQTATATASDPMTYSWSKVSGPGTIAFGSPTALSTTVSADTDGLYMLRFTATGSSGQQAYADMRLVWWDSSSSSVSYQINQAHTGFISMSSFKPPLRVRWSANLGSGISYPVIAGGKVFVTVKNTSGYGTNLYALSSATGSVVWGPVFLGGTYYWSSCCYEAGRVFALNYDGLLKAFDANTGQLIWSTQLGQYSFSSAPTAYNGIVYAGGSGEVYAVDESNGTVLWTAPVEGGDESSPAVSDDGVYVSYVCSLSYKFNPVTGSQLWNFQTGCFGGGGKTPVLYNGNLYVRDFIYTSYILNASTGTSMGNFVSKTAPAFSGNIGIFLNASQSLDSTGPINAYDVTSNSLLWSFAGDGNLWSAPVIINNDVYTGSSSGNLYAVNINTGSQDWTANVGMGIPHVDEYNVSQPLTGFGAGEGLLVIPAASTLVAYESFDNTPPVVSAGGDRIANAQFTQTATATDASPMTYSWSKVSGPGIVIFGSPEALSTTISASTDGTYTLRFTATDAAGNASSSQMVLVWDATRPSGTVIINNGAAYTGSASVNLTLSATDGVCAAEYPIMCNVTQMQLSSDNAVWTEWEPASTSRAWQLSSGDGQNTVFARFMDAAGNISSVASDNIILDTSAPASYITSPSGNALISGRSCTIAGTATDGTGSGVNKVEVSINNGPWTAATGTYTWSFAWQAAGSGEYNLKSRATDNAGNIETPGAGITPYIINPLGSPELPHFNWDASVPQGACSLCHVASSTFLSGSYMTDAGFCRSCHNSSGVGHGQDLYGRHGHITMANVTSGGGRLPTYGNITAGEYNNEPYTKLKGGNKIVCTTCHNVMAKPEDMGRAWEYTTTGDNMTYTLQNGGWAGYNYLVPKVYRDTSLWSGPTYSKTRRAYLVDPSEYTYDETAGTVMFKSAQPSAVYIYVTLDYPYLRASNGGNRLCGDCHTQVTHKGANCLICHRAHNTDNLADIRGDLRMTNRTTATVKFLRYSGFNSFADGDGTHDGICEVCHTQTKYYRRDGSQPFANHSGGFNYDRRNCTTCHSHGNGFSRGDSPPAAILGSGDSGQQRSYPVGSIVEVDLSTCFDCGEDWFANSLDGSMVQVVNKVSVPPPPGIIGGMGTTKWYFKMLAPGDTTATLLEYRPWEGPGHATSSFNLNLHIY